MINPVPPLNRFAMISLVTALATSSSFCIGLAPIPLTAWVCYPLAIVLGLGALFSGFMGLRQIRVSGERGRWMALVGLWMGVIMILAVICFTTLSIGVLALGAGYFQSIFQQAKP